MTESHKTDPDGPHPEPSHPEPRRNFLNGCAAVLIGGIVVIPPLGAGLAVLTDPLTRGAKSEGDKDGVWVKVCKLTQVPADGTPKRFKVVAEKVDAWTHSVGELGSIYLRRTSETEKPLALQAACPHVGCIVTYKSPIFNCPCHNSNFEPDGKRIDPEHSPSPRDMDTLDVDVRAEQEVWVNFMNFKSSTAAKEPV
jgi:menaquinol-cytochrome c reductase iron-sulfur subunit